MKYIRQICIILLLSVLGEGLHFWIPLPIPASIYGLCCCFWRSVFVSSVWNGSKKQGIFGADFNYFVYPRNSGTDDIG